MVIYIPIASRSRKRVVAVVALARGLAGGQAQQCIRHLAPNGRLPAALVQPYRILDRQLSVPDRELLSAAGDGPIHRSRSRGPPRFEETTMPGANSFKFVLLPPQSDTTRDWAKRLAEIVPEARVIVAEDADTAAREIVDAEAAFGWLSSDLLSRARNLRWLQAPQAAPPAGYYYPELIAHSVVVTNFR